MDTRRLRRLMVAVIASGLPVSATAAAQGVFFVATNSEYDMVEYVPAAKAPARHLVYAGEPLGLRLSFGNRNATTETLSTKDVPIERAFQVTAKQMPEGAALPVLVLRRTGHVRGSQSQHDIEWSDSLEIPGQGELTLFGSLTFGPETPPGVYEMTITPNLSSSARMTLLGTIVRFEIRPVSTVADEVEILHRRMMRAYQHDDTAGAAAAADALLAKYQTSAPAYRLKATLAQDAGQKTQAIAALTKARELLVSGQDTLWVAQHGPYDTREAIADLTRRLDHLTKGTPLYVH